MRNRYRIPDPTSTPDHLPPETDGAAGLTAPSSPVIGIEASGPASELITARDELLWHGILYADCYWYFDTLKFLSHVPLAPDVGATLHAHSKHLDIRTHGEVIRTKTGRRSQINIEPWRYRIEKHVPDDTALAIFAKLRFLKLTRADLALDFTFDDARARVRMMSFLSEHLVQPRQRKSRKRVTFNNGNFSTGRRGTGSYFTLYDTKECRIDGVVDSVHIDHRHSKAKILAGIGLSKPEDLPTFDHANHWQRLEQSGHLLAIDKERLGRFHRNRHAKQKSRVSDQTPFNRRRSKDFAAGALLYRYYGTDDYGSRNVQEFLQTYGRGPYVIDLGRERMNARLSVDTETPHTAALGGPNGQRSRPRLR